jgi:hypothetical protein
MKGVHVHMDNTIYIIFVQMLICKMIIRNFNLVPLIHWPYYSGENKAALIVDGLFAPGTYSDRQPVQIL